MSDTNVCPPRTLRPPAPLQSDAYLINVLADYLSSPFIKRACLFVP